MLDLAMTTSAPDDTSVTVGYSCPCGCTPAATYHRDDAAVTEGCCCGNEMAIGPDAAVRVSGRSGFETQLATVTSPWQEPITVAWAIGPSTHPDEHDDHQSASTAIDPVCGMTVERESAVARGLHLEHAGLDYYFCGKGCKLEFGDDPQRFLAPGYVPSM